VRCEIADRRLVDLTAVTGHVTKPHAHKLLQQNLTLLIEEADLSFRVNASSDSPVSYRGSAIPFDGDIRLVGAFDAQQRPVLLIQGWLHGMRTWRLSLPQGSITSVSLAYSRTNALFSRRNILYLVRSKQLHALTGNGTRKEGRARAASLMPSAYLFLSENLLNFCGGFLQGVCGAGLPGKRFLNRGASRQ
jgi:hypothetical protein